MLAKGCRIPFPKLPQIDLRAASKLQHVKLTGFIPGSTHRVLLLPPGCALCLAGYSEKVDPWSQHWVGGRDAVTVVSLWPAECLYQNIGVLALCAWPQSLESFPALKHLRLDYLHTTEALDIAIFARIPCLLKICSKKDLAMTISTGSWQVLELHGRCMFKVFILNVPAFLRSVSVFAFSLRSDCMQTLERLVEVCHMAHVPVHKLQFDCPSLSFSRGRPCCQMVKLSNDLRYVQSVHPDSAVLTGVWPADPVESATDRLKQMSSRGTHTWGSRCQAFFAPWTALCGCASEVLSPYMAMFTWDFQRDSVLVLRISHQGRIHQSTV